MKPGIQSFRLPGRYALGSVDRDEFGLAALCYPIIFDTQSKTPLAVMGLRPGMNVFLAATARLIQKFICRRSRAAIRSCRSSPMVSSRMAPKADGDRVLVCIDRAAKMISNQPELPFFDGDNPSRYTQEAIQFCKEFDALGRRTQEFVKLMEEHDLFELTPLALPRAKPDGTPAEPQKIGEYLRISEAKLNKLSQDVYLQLRDRGVSAVVHAHLLSLGLWPKILTPRRAHAGCDASG